jgi:glycosyltransferase involved in cell wall biosynthesis
VTRETTLVVDALQVGAEPTGVGRLVAGVGRELRDLPPHVQLELRCTRESGPLLAPAFPPSARIRTPLRRSRPRWLRIVYQQLLAPLRDDRGTLLLCPGDQGPVWGRARVVLSLNDVRRLVRPDTVGWLERAYYGFVVRRVVRRASLVVTISEFSRREIREALGPSIRVEVAPIHPPPAPGRLGGDADGHVLVVGAVRRYKCVETVVEALAALPVELRRRVLVAGPLEGRALELQRAAQERGVAEWFRLVGWVDEAELQHLYETAATTISPSTYEGYGLPVAESLSYGLPTIASDIPPHREVAGEAALYFPPSDAAALADRLRRVLTERDLRGALVDRARQRSEQLAQSTPAWRELVVGLLSLA